MVASFLRKSIFLIPIDTVLYYGAISLAIFLRAGNPLSYPYFSKLLLHFTILLPLFLLVFFSLRLYEAHRMPLGHFFRYSTFAFGAALGISVLYFYFLSSAIVSPKVILFYFFAVYMLVWHGTHLALRSFLLRVSSKEKVALIGEDASIKELADAMARANVPSVSNVYRKWEDYASGASDEGVQTVVCAPSVFLDDSLMARIAAHTLSKARIMDVCAAYEEFLQKIPLSGLSQAWVLQNLSGASKSAGYSFARRALDVAIGCAGLALTGLFLPFVYLLVKIEDGGSVFFQQKRVGREGKAFTLYKFRTMREAPEERGPLWTTHNDPRLTRTGKLLRRLHIDELPQAINILRGEMRFVGPRAERVELAEMFEKEIPFYSLRHVVAPGVTGWAQLHVPASASVEEARKKLEYDLYYIKNQSLFLDLEIILKTLSILVLKRYIA